MTQHQTWRCAHCHTNNDHNDHGVLRCRRCETVRAPQVGQIRPDQPRPDLVMSLAPAPPSAGSALGPRHGPKAGLWVLIASAVVGLVVALVISLGEDSPTTGTPSGSATGADPATDTEPPAAPRERPAPAPPSARELLDRQVAEDGPAVERLTRRWVPQVSSKQPGMVVAGRQMDLDGIHADHARWKRRHPDALLLWSGDYASFKQGDYWVVVIDQPFADPAAANRWCDRALLGPGDCFARRISHSAGVGPNTVHR